MVVGPRALAVVAAASVRCGLSGVVAEAVVAPLGDLGAMAAVNQGDREGVLVDRGGACRIPVAVAEVAVSVRTAVVVEVVAAYQVVEGMEVASQGDPSVKAVEVASGLVEVVEEPPEEVASCRMATGALVVVAEGFPWKGVVVAAVHRVGMVALVGTVVALEACHLAWVEVAAGLAVVALANLQVEAQVALFPGPQEEEQGQPLVVEGAAHPRGVHRQTADGVGPSGPGDSVQPADAPLPIRAARPSSPS